MTTPSTLAGSTQPGAAGDVLKYITDDCDIVVPIGFGEPPTLIQTIEDHATEFDRVRIHQMDPFVSRRYIRGEFSGHLRHIDYLSRTRFAAGVLGRHMRLGARSLLGDAATAAHRPTRPW